MSQKPLRCGPRPLILWCALLALSWSILPAALLAGEVRTTADLKDVAEVVDHYVKQYGAEHVLLIADVDNTMLAMDQPLGSDQWFTWQQDLLTKDPGSPYLVAHDFPGLLKAQGLMYELGRMHPPQRDAPAVIRRLQDQGIFTLVLTSRGDEFRDATERELSRNGFDFNRSALSVKDVPGGVFLPYDLEHPAAAGFTPDEVTAFQLGTPRPVSYAGGIYMTAGQNKGAMFLVLLPHVLPEVKAVVYVDDSQKNVDRVYQAATGRHLEATVFRYHREDANVRAFQCGGKWECVRHWRCIEGKYAAALQ
jgi:Protein of unknown function (DUF2608)